ncbi:MAG: integrase core domain-containing protein, partial [Microbacterium sp.]|nr:integrase core domain-containing protein [Microbacterium sp.]
MTVQSKHPKRELFGDAYDNAVAESFFATLETEFIDRHAWRTRADARLAVFDFIEAWYNPHRRHSFLVSCRRPSARGGIVLTPAA